MAAQSDDQEKSHEATPYKLEEARKKGTVAKSVEWSSVLSLAGGVLLLLALGADSLDRLLDFAHDTLAVAGTFALSGGALLNWLGVLPAIVVPFLVAMMALAIVGNVSQTGMVFSSEPLKPDFNRMNPAQGLKKLFSRRVLFDLAKNLLKLVLVSAVIYLFFLNSAVDFHALLQTTAPVASTIWSTLMFRMVAYVLLVLVLVAIVDFLFVKRDFLRRMRMSHREMDEEIKRREGDPHIRSKRRQIEKELRKKAQALGRVKESDIIITNPVHVAVAIKYDRRKAVAPRVLAKGQGEMAARIRHEAYRHKIPVYQYPALARLIYKKTPIDGLIPEESFTLVARLLKSAYRKKRTPNGTQ